MDAAITGWINGLAGVPALDALMRSVSAYGVPLIVALVVLQWWSRRDRIHIRHVAIAAGLAFLLGLAINQAVLLGVHRVRPYDDLVTHLLIAPSKDWSFPSDHATASVAVAMVFLRKGLWGRGLVLTVLAALVCFSRVYLGIHYVGDILGGALTGVLAAVVVLAAYSEGNRLDRFATGIL